MNDQQYKNNIQNNNRSKTTDFHSTNQRSKRSHIAHQTLAILEEGEYVNEYDRRVQIGMDLQRAIRDSILYRPTELIDLREKRAKEMVQMQPATEASAVRIEVTGETTLAAASRLSVDEGREDVVCLNFASAKNPGGGFLGGSQAQEESLARATGLYPCIAQMSEMYDYNRKLRSCLYSDYMIYSPAVPVIRDDEDRLLGKYYLTSFITAPAVNAGVVRDREDADEQQIESVMKGRIRYILDVAALHGHQTIVLGAYGCGVFRNDPADVAKYFHDVLVEEKFRHSFERIVFAVLDRSAGQKTLKAFEDRLAGD
ncbi:TIGR02452 family protein [Paenibacillus sp. OK076]|uniref:TIGR02452 family protein n=1 Tax=Paenibacillus sp. OK076 TaxID=1884379 RepID=UPI0008D88A37|nr:TIGR02452 family protein [Paenibacillus sp. OK076]SEM79670.1 TIGR02452 family protein [Paenibacillus sp. OK076]